MAKKLLALLVAAVMVLGLIPAAALAKTEEPFAASAQESTKAAWVVDQWDFEEDPLENGWQFLDQDGDGRNWTWTTDYAYNDSTHSIMSGSYINGSACSPDNWAVLPAVELPADAEVYLTYYVKGQSMSYPETYTIMIGLEEDLSDMSPACGDLSTSTESTDWEERTLSLTEYNGNTVYIAFRNYGTYDQWKMYIDDVMITAETGSPEPIEPPDVAGAILFTNDVHCGIEDGWGYAGVAAAKKAFEGRGIDTLLVDAGDHIQGGPIGTLSRGQYIIDIMNYVGYDLATPGNHEFDYTMDQFFNLVDSANYPYISANFMHYEDGQPTIPVLEAYKMFELGGYTVAFVGLSTPETLVKSTPTYFQDENGNYIYGFCQDETGEGVYEACQNAIDAARAEGADYVIVLGHMGIDEQSEPWRSTDVIAHISGCDAFIDGHSHSAIDDELVIDADGNPVHLLQTGTKLENLGRIFINNDGSLSCGIYPAEDLETIGGPDADTQEFIDNIKAQYEELLQTVVAYTEHDLVVNDPETGERIVRKMETNLGDLCADAYRDLFDCDVAFVNGGGVRANILEGEVTFENILNVHPFGNSACLVEVTGQQILDALEMGSRNCPAENGGFLQCSGIQYEIHTYIPANVVLGTDGMWLSAGDGEYRVKNVKIMNRETGEYEPIDLEATYTLASHNYMLKSCGDGFGMFGVNNINLLADEVKLDNAVLIDYISTMPGGEVDGTEYDHIISGYADPYGEGRIIIVNEEPPVEPMTELDEALNVGGGTLHFETSETYPWIVVEDGDRVFAQSGNAGVASTTSTLTLNVDLEEAQTIYFEFKAWGEGSYTFWDHCDFAIDGEVQFTYGAYDNDWELYSCLVPAGAHTLTWTYTKDSSVNPTGDYFAVDNVSLGAAPEYTVTFVDGLDNTVLGEITVEAGTVLTDDDFPTPPEHEGYEFVGWNYNGDAIMQDTTITARYRDPNAPNAIIILNVPVDVWSDGSGYQMLLDADATAYGTIIPETGGLTSSGDAPQSVYDEFEYKIPENADGSMTTSNVVVTGQIAIEIPAGTYDWCITNPTPGDRIWIASSNGNIPGRYDDYEFEAGLTYTFTVTLGGQNDRVDLEISGDTPPTEEPPTEEPPTEEPPTNPPTGEPVEGLIVGYYFETQEEVDEWAFVGGDTNWVWSFDNPGGYDYTELAHEGEGFIMSYSFVDYVGSYQANNWAISPAVTLPSGTASVSFYASNANSSYPETFSVYVGTTPDTANMTLLQTITPTTGYDDEWSYYEIDLSDYAGQTIYLAFYDGCYDMYEIWIDQVEFWGEGGSEPEPIAIHEVWVDGWGTPVEGVAGIDHVFLTTPDGAPYYIIYGGWRDETDQQQMWSDEHVFIAGHEYSEGAQIWAEEGYYFAEDCVFHTNDGDEILDLEWCYVDEADNYICYMNILPVVCEGEEPPVPEMHGDVDLNGTVQVADAILALRYQMGLIGLTDEQLEQAEVNGVDGISLADSILILRYAMGLIDHFPIEG